MAEIKSASAIAEKWSRVTPQRVPDYENGVRQPGKDWANNTAAAESSFEAGIQNAIQQKRFGKGVKNAGTAKWQSKTLEKGTQRWGPGVSVAQSDYENGFAPYRDEIERTSLPPRYPKGDPRNIERVSKLAKALHAKKMSG